MPTLDDLLSAPGTHSWGHYNFAKSSLAVVALGDHGPGIVLHTVGGHLRMEMSEGGLDNTEDLGIHLEEPGIWVWEGKGVWYPGSYEYPNDGSMELVGSYRPPTDGEWAAIRKGECPWDDAEWKEQETE